MTKINSLYTLIKEQKEKKGRPLKIVCDWDDCLQAHRAWYIFQASPDKDNLDKFPEYFETYFYEGTTKSRKEVIEFTKRAKKEKSLLANYRNELGKNRGMKERFKAPFTILAKDLLRALKENLVEDLIVISSFSYEGEKDESALLTCLSNNGKAEKFARTFGKFPGSFLEITELKKNIPYRWERINQLCSDFDMFIDDKKELIKEAIKGLAEKKDKIYVLPDYQSNKKIEGPNIYKVRSGISSELKTSDFIFKNAARKIKGIEGSSKSSPWDGEEDTTINSLYELIKEQKQKKSRPIKVICDWDECILPVRPWAVHHFSDKKIPFPRLFDDFWEHTEVSEGSVGGNKDIKYDGKNEKIKEAIEKFRALKKRRREGSKEPDFYSTPERYKSPFLSIPNELLQCLKEDLISELVVVSSYRKGKLVLENQGKKDIFNKTFGQFPNTQISIYEVGRDKQGNNVPHRYEWIRDNHPDFDIFIDDNYSIIKSSKKNFSADKTFVLPDYKYSRDMIADNVYHVKTAVSDLKIEDFTKVAKEYKAKKKAEELAIVKQHAERERERAKLYWIMGGGVVILFLGVLLVIFWRKSSKKKVKRA